MTANAAPGGSSRDGLPRAAWLRRHVEPDEAERIHTLPGQPPFGAAHDAWRRLLARRQPGEELWIYDSRPHVGPDACANYGVALVRHGRPVDHILLRIG